MMKLSYYESADPILERFFRWRTTPLRQPYAGYLFFLFGDSDAEAAAWFSQHLLALDALTGSSIAGLVFAQTVKTKARRVELEVHGRHSEPSLREGDQVDIQKIRRADENEQTRRSRGGDLYDSRLVSREQEICYEPEREISAITYGSYAVARELGVTENLPCIVLVDGYLKSSIDVIELNTQNRDGVMQSLRKLISRYTSQEEYSDFFGHLVKIHHVSRQIDDAQDVLDKAVYAHERKLKWIFPARTWRLQLLHAIRYGREKDFRRILRSTVELGGDENRLLRNFAERSSDRIGQASAEVLERELSGILPDTSAFIDLVEKNVAKHLLPLNGQIASFRSELARLEALREGLGIQLSTFRVPQIRKAFRELSRQTGVKVKSKQAGSGLAEWLSGWTKPEVVLKVGQFLADHHPHLF